MASNSGMSLRLAFLLASTATAAACSGSSDNSSSGGDGGPGGSGASGSGNMTYACTLQGLCAQSTGTMASFAATQTNCTQVFGGTLTIGTCPTAGSFGCCVDMIGAEKICAYSAQEAQATQAGCMTGKTWVPADGGGGSGGASDAGASDDGASDAAASGPAAFVGTWARAGTQTVTCPAGTTTVDLKGNLVIALGSTSDTIVTTQPDGCTTTFTVTGNTATATAGQTCTTTTDAGVTTMNTVTSRTLTLSTDGLTIMSQGSDTIDKTATSTMCTGMSSVTLTKK